MRAKALRLGIPPERTICTGDVVAYCADPAETIALIRDWGIHVVLGNCQAALGFQEQECTCGFPEDTECGRLSRHWYAYVNSFIARRPS